MWGVQGEELPAERGLRCQVRLHGRPASRRDVFAGWQADEAFRAWFDAQLAGLPYAAFRWETPAVTAGSLGEPFEFVALDSPGLDRPAEPRAFAEHFVPGAQAVEFANLGGDCTLVVPCPLAEDAVYTHLAAFVRRAPESQRHALWRLVGSAALRRVGERPVWLSTAGAGVAWLHVRLDDRPKYYGFAPYRYAA